jgi:hypothetical protein
VFFFVVKPMTMLKEQRDPGEEAVSDEERRHQELLAAFAQLGR